MKKSMKRGIALICVLTMLLSLMPAVFADEFDLGFSMDFDLGGFDSGGFDLGNTGMGFDFGGGGSQDWGFVAPVDIPVLADNSGIGALAPESNIPAVDDNSGLGDVTGMGDDSIGDALPPVGEITGLGDDSIGDALPPAGDLSGMGEISDLGNLPAEGDLTGMDNIPAAGDNAGLGAVTGMGDVSIGDALPPAGDLIGMGEISDLGNLPAEGDLTGMDNIPAVDDNAGLGDVTGLGDVSIGDALPPAGEIADMGDDSGLGDIPAMDDNTGLGDIPAMDDNTGLGEITGMGDVSIEDALLPISDNTGIGDNSGLGDVTGMGDNSMEDALPPVSDNTGIGDNPGLGDVTGMGDVSTESDIPAKGAIPVAADDVPVVEDNDTVQITMTEDIEYVQMMTPVYVEGKEEQNQQKITEISSQDTVSEEPDNETTKIAEENLISRNELEANTDTKAQDSILLAESIGLIVRTDNFQENNDEKIAADNFGSKDVRENTPNNVTLEESVTTETLLETIQTNSFLGMSGQVSLKAASPTKAADDLLTLNYGPIIHAISGIGSETTTTMTPGQTKTQTARGVLNLAGGSNYGTGHMAVEYKFLNVYVLSSEENKGEPVYWNSAEDGLTVKKVGYKGNGEVIITFSDDTTKTLTDTTTVYLSPVYSQTPQWSLDYEYVDNVSYGSGSWSNLEAVTSGYSHTFSEPQSQPHYLFKYWQEDKLIWGYMTKDEEGKWVMEEVGEINEENPDRYEAGETFIFSTSEDSNSSPRSQRKKDAENQGKIYGEEIFTYAYWQPSVTVKYHNDGKDTTQLESFEDIPDARNTAEAVASLDNLDDDENIRFEGWHDADDNNNLVSVLNDNTAKIEAPEITKGSRDSEGNSEIYYEEKDLYAIWQPAVIVNYFSSDEEKAQKDNEEIEEWIQGEDYEKSFGDKKAGSEEKEKIEVYNSDAAKNKSATEEDADVMFLGWHDTKDEENPLSILDKEATYSAPEASTSRGKAIIENLVAVMQPAVIVNYFRNLAEKVEKDKAEEENEDFSWEENADYEKSFVSVGDVYNTESAKNKSKTDDAGVSFEGWYDEDGNRVSDDVTFEYKAPEATTSSSVAAKVINLFAKFITAITVTKEWNDDSDRDGIRPDEATIELYKEENAETGKVKIDEVKLSSENAVVIKTENADTVAVADLGSNKDENVWSWTFENLLAYDDNGNLIKYSVDEPDVPNTFDDNGDLIDYSAGEAGGPDYTKSISGSVADGFIIKNTHDPYCVDLPISKIWDDDNDRDGIRPDGITINLFADGQKIDSITISGENNEWRGIFEKLYKNQNGEKINYTVKEAEVPEGYTAGNPVEENGVFTITNRHNPETLSIQILKSWDDDNNRDGLRPDEITINLLADGQKLDSVTISGENDEWSGIFEKLYKYQNGEEITYTVTEEKVNGYDEPTIVGSAANGVFTITNTHVPETLSIQIQKNWDDAGNQDGIRPDEITINLLADGQMIKSVTISEENDEWRGIFEELYKYQDGEEITYTVSEDNVEGYDEPTIDGSAANGFTITNTHAPEVLSIRISKDWDDAGYQSDIRPEIITIHLLADGEEIAEVTIKEQDGEWSHIFENLEKFKRGEQGKEVEYKVKEDEVEGYEAGIAETEDGFAITNKRTAADPSDEPGDEPEEPEEPEEPDIPDIPVVPVVFPDPAPAPAAPANFVNQLLTIDDFETPLGLGGIYTNLGDCFE